MFNFELIIGIILSANLKISVHPIAGKSFSIRKLAFALVWRPELLIIDEPLAHLDVNAQLVVLQDLRDFADSEVYPLSIILSSQHLHETEAIADKWLFMKDGHVEMIKDLKINNKYNLFEISCSLNENEMRNLLKEVHYKRLSKNQVAYIIKTLKLPPRNWY